MPSIDDLIIKSWDDIELEEMREGISRKFINSDALMIAEVRLPVGSLVPAHRHANEQVTYMISGCLRFHFGDALDHEVVLHAGEVAIIPSNLLHRAEALEDTFELDVFTPPRADWINGSDAYLREE